MCARFFNELLWFYIRVVHGQAAGCMFYEPVHPGGAQNKTLISNTAVRRLYDIRSLTTPPLHRVRLNTVTTSHYRMYSAGPGYLRRIRDYF